MPAEKRHLRLHDLGLTDYEPVWRDMQRFTETRNAGTADEIWFTEHRPVFTLGVNADRQHVLTPGDIPIVAVDRGGQVTYHGPGQLMVYPLIDLRRASVGVRDLVSAMEQSVIASLARYNVASASRRDAPGVYVEGRKIASVGLRIRRGASFHGMAFNVDVDVTPFSYINPCGFTDLQVTNCRLEGITATRDELKAELTHHLLEALQLPGIAALDGG